MQTGVIMLIGLLSKTAILLTEYASERRRAGMSIPLAALAAARGVDPRELPLDLVRQRLTAIGHIVPDL